jgi:GNAT superfamily N-acetyltransferase
MRSGPTAEIRYAQLTGPSARPWFDRLVGLYALVYAEPPYGENPEDVAEFAEGLPEESTRPGFELVTATSGRLLVGAAYGWTMPGGAWWSNADGDPPPDVRSADKLAIMEWMVRPEHRGGGVGAELMRLLLSGRSEPWATLTSDPQSAARDVYERAGWRQVGRTDPERGPLMHVLALPLGGTAGAED